MEKTAETREKKPGMSEKILTESVRNPKRRRSVFFGLLFGLGVMIIIIIWWIFNRPALGNITKLVPSGGAELTTVETKKSYTGKYFTFFYPASYTEKAFDTPLRAPMLERAFWSKQDMRGAKLALLVQDFRNYPFDEFPSFQMRNLDNEVYSSEKVVKNDIQLTLFTKKTSVFEVAAFFQKNGNVVSLVISSPVSVEGLREELLIIIESWQWNDEESPK